MRQSSRCRGGFTLMELLLVLAVLVIITALAMPSLSGAMANQKLRKAGDLVRSEFARARNRSMRTGRIHVFRYLPGTGEYSLEPWYADDDFLESNVQTVGMAPVNADAVSSETVYVQLPDGITFSGLQVEFDARAMETVGEAMQSTSPTAGAPASILFYPDGQSSTARIVLSNQASYYLIIQLRGLTGIAKVTDLLNNSELYEAMNPTGLD